MRAHVPDHRGHLWRVAEARPTAHGWDLLLGHPASYSGRGRPRVILTADLAAHLEAHRRAPSRADLPLASGTLARLRAELGHHRARDAAAWWAAREADLRTLTLEAFAARHGVSTGAASEARAALASADAKRPPSP